MRDLKQTFRTFAARACARAALCAALLLALHAAAGASLAQEKTAEAQEKVAKEGGVQPPVAIKTKSLEDWARKAKQLYDERKLDAFTKVDVSEAVELNDDGTFKPESVVTTWAEASDETVASLVRQLFAVVSDSKVLGVLKDARQVTIRLRVDEANALLSVSSSMPSAERARQMAEGYSAIVRLAAITKKGRLEGELYEGLRFDSDDKLFVFKFLMPKERLGVIITEMLAKKDAAAHS